MSNPKIETDIAQILLEIKSDLKELKTDVASIKTQLAVVQNNQGNMKGQLSRIDGTQTTQIWALIVAVFGIVGVLAIAFFNLRSRI